MAEKETYGGNAMDNVSEKGGFKIFLYNPRTGQFLGRTCASWCKITIFYIILYLCLSAFWTILLVVFYQTLDVHEPKWKQEYSRIGNVPGLGFRPIPPEETIDSTLIWFKHAGNDNKKDHWINNLNDYLEPYRKLKDAETNNKHAEHVMVCEGVDKLPEKRVCIFDVSQIKSPCTKEDSFGYDIGHPCVLIKLNRIFGWEPEPYENGEFPDKMPPNITSVYDPKFIYVSCEGENAADRENMGLVEYYPTNKIPNYFFPFTNLEGYVSPFVFVHFVKPNTGVLINIECKAWAKNIEHDRMERKGSVHFELLVD